VLEKVGGKVTSPPSLKDGSDYLRAGRWDQAPGSPIYEMPEEVILEIVEAFPLCGLCQALRIRHGHRSRRARLAADQFMSPTRTPGKTVGR
jgi:hypothetical protein